MVSWTVLGKALPAGGWEATSIALCPVLGSPVQERHKCNGERPAKGHRDEGNGASSPM